MFRKRFWFIILSFLSIQLNAQEKNKEGDFFGVGISYGLNIPAADMADRFGLNFHAGLSLDWFKQSWNGSYGLEGLFLFGSEVKEDVLANARTSNGAILGFDGEYADIFLRQRGTYFGAYIQKTLVPQKGNDRSGLAASFGIGVLQHKIRIQDDTRNATQFEGEYKKGYDRNTVGPAFKQSLSYLHLSKTNNVNFKIAIEFTEGITSSNRAVNFDTMEKPSGNRFDLLIGLNLKWFIPLKDMREPEEIFY
ncbi:MAG: hypothetical protein HKN67_14045 [Saprospiraceae bacterium]|nr:hypothetical protein [Bacteroidia bacterium]NNF23056.1 hypothetical protein [Saprospiraceae bacterium]